MKKQVFNPYLPSWEYIPDGEPRVFDGRLYVYGSHDCFNGDVYCQNDYVCWSAPEDDLSDWRYEGVIFKKTQDPRNADGAHALWAPDVCRGNTHGSVISVGGKWYVFYHRQTNRHFFSRQACAEEIFFDGESFHQAEITSCGLNGGPLKDECSYEARIACHLYSKNGTCESLPDQQDENHPAFTQEGEDRMDNPNQYIQNMVNGSTAGFRYFNFTEAKTISIDVRGSACGEFVVRDGREGSIVSRIPVSPAESWKTFAAPLSIGSGKKALYFTFEGTGSADFMCFAFSR